jgi:hypothetical protein
MDRMQIQPPLLQLFAIVKVAGMHYEASGDCVPSRANMMK